MIKHTFSLAILAVPLFAFPALAQTDTTMMMRNGAANELGVLEYCQSQGAIDGSAIAAQKQVMARLPAGGPTDAAEATGREGSLSVPNGTAVTLSSMATKGNTTVPALCQQMASSVKQAVVNNPAMSMSPGTMPTMPGGMPTMPTMPAMPGTPTQQQQ
jgi:hypothetical protein